MLTRRNILATSLAAPLILHRGMPLAGEGDPLMPMRAFERFRLGDMMLTLIDDGSFAMPVAMFTGGASAAERKAFLDAHDMRAPALRIPLQVMLVEHQGHRTLIDTGLGDINMHGGGADHGRLLATLAALGLAPGDIDTVILTHGHPDHIGGLTRNGEPTFHAATHRLPDPELAFWTQNPDSAPQGLQQMIRECRRHLLPVRHAISGYEDGEEISPGIFAVAAPGHTHGHFAMRLESRGETLLNIVDTAVFHAAGLEHPEWTIGADIDKSQAVATRKRLFAEAADKEILVAAAHFPYPGIGHITRQGPAYAFRRVQTG